MSWVAVGWTMISTSVTSTESMSLLETLIIVMWLVWESEGLWLINGVDQPVRIRAWSRLEGDVPDWEELGVVRIVDRHSRRSVWIVTKDELKASTIVDTDRKLNVGLSVAGLKGEVRSKLNLLSEELTLVCCIL